jgi:hypothetical protein
MIIGRSPFPLALLPGRCAAVERNESNHDPHLNPLDRDPPGFTPSDQDGDVKRFV